MADCKSINKYYPPDWDPSDGNLNKYHNSHHLRERAKKLSEGILIVRMEAPFNMVCNCKEFIAKGTRFNASKRKTEMFYLEKSIPIYELTIKCKSCKGLIILQSNYKKDTYDITMGAKKRSQENENEDSIIR